MKALIWKELRQQLVWLLVALSLATQMWFGMGDVWKQLVLPIGEGFLVFLLWPLVYAFALAQLQFGRDGDERRFGQLVHRGRGARGYFASKMIVGCAAVACLIVLPVTVWALVKSVSDPDASLIRWVRVPQIILFCVPAFVTYSVGVLSAQLRRGTLLRWGLAVCGIFSAFIMPLLGLFQGSHPSTASLWGAVSIVVTALTVLWLARSLLIAGRDRDLPLRGGHLIALALALVALVLPLTTFVFGTLESHTLSAVQQETPFVLRDPMTDEFIVAGRIESDWRKLVIRDGQIVGATDVSLYPRLWHEMPGFTPRGAVFLFEPEGLELVHMGGGSPTRYISEETEERTSDRWLSSETGEVVLDEDAGLGSVPWKLYARLSKESAAVEVFAKPFPENASISLRPVRCLLERPDRPFSKDSGIGVLGYKALAVLDHADGTLWSIQLQPGTAKLARIPAPGDDVLLGADRFVGASGVAFGVEAGLNTRGDVLSEVFIGRRGTYVFEREALRTFQPDESLVPKGAVLCREAEKLARYSVTDTWPDALTEELNIERLADGQRVFSLTVVPRTGEAPMAARIYAVLALLRAPGAVIAERLFGWTSSAGVADEVGPWERRLFTNGKHPLLFALAMLFGAFQLFIGWRWMARGGVGIGTRVAYMLLILEGGVVALILTRLLLPRGLKTTRASEAVSWTGDSPRPLHASSSRS